MTSLSSLSRAQIAVLFAALATVGLVVLSLTGGPGPVPVGALGAGALVSLLCALHFQRRVGRAAGKAARVCAAMARGDFEVRVTEIRDSGDIGEMLWSINEIIDRTDAFLRESTASMAYVSRNQYFRRIVETGMVGGFLDSARVINRATDAIAVKTGEFKGVAARFEEHVYELVQAFSAASNQLDVTARKFEGAAEETSQQAASGEAASDQAASSVRTVASAAVQLESSIAEIGAQTVHSTEASANAVNEIDRTDENVRALAGAADRIGEVVEMIAGFADQTSLLALNATIEAARPGSAGKGFAVVAQEVKTLATQTTAASENITGLVTTIQSRTANTVSGVGAVRGTIRQVSEVVSAIAAAIEEQSAATKEIAESVEMASAGTNEMSENIRTVAAAANDTGTAATEVHDAAAQLSRQSNELDTRVASFLTELRSVV